MERPPWYYIMLWVLICHHGCGLSLLFVFCRLGSSLNFVVGLRRPSSLLSWLLLVDFDYC